MTRKANDNKKNVPENPNSAILNKSASYMKLDELRAYCTKFDIAFHNKLSVRDLREIVKQHKKKLKEKQPKQETTERDLIKNETYEKFVEFSALPDIEKCLMLEMEPDKQGKYNNPTLERFAEKFGVSVGTLSNWKKRSDYRERVDGRNDKWGVELTPSIMGALAKRCLRYGRSDDVALWLAYYKNWTPKQIVETVEKFDVEDIRILVKALPDEKQQKYKQFLKELVTEVSRNRESA